METFDKMIQTCPLGFKSRIGVILRGHGDPTFQASLQVKILKSCVETMSSRPSACNLVAETGFQVVGTTGSWFRASAMTTMNKKPTRCTIVLKSLKTYCILIPLYMFRALLRPSSGAS
jgi:hypothetical protein